MTKFYKQASKIEMHSLRNNYVGSVNKYLYQRNENPAVSGSTKFWEIFKTQLLLFLTKFPLFDRNISEHVSMNSIENN